MRPPISIEVLRAYLLAALRDCQGPAADRMRARVVRAASAQELCLERSDLYQLVARRDGEARAQLMLGVTAGPARPLITSSAPPVP
jgi:hypothetical protein